VAAGFRESVGTDTDDPRFIQLVGELSLASERFRELWGRHDVRPYAGRAVTLDHPQVGELTLNREKLVIAGTAGQVLAIYHADAGGVNADKLSLLLASYQAGPHTPAPTDRATPALG
jgi:hypothetical protein